MKVLLIASYCDSVVKFRGPLIAAMLANGCEVHVAAPRIKDSPQVRATIEAKGAFVHDFPVRRTGTNPVADARMLLALFLLMRKLRPDATLPYTLKPVVYGTVAAWFAGVPRRFALVTGLGYAFTGSRRGLIKQTVTTLYRFALARATKVFFQNPDDNRHFRESGILPPRVPSVVLNGSGVDVDEYAIEPVPKGPTKFLLIGRLLGDKGVREYVEAARRIRLARPEASFGLVGWIDENPDAIAQAELDAWIAEDLIEFEGQLADVRPALADCSVYVLPSYREGTPRTVLEAMAMGRPIITTDAPGCRETVVDGDNGFLVPVRSVDALVLAMLRFIDDPRLAPRMGARSRRIAEDKYDVKKVNEVMLQEMGIADRKLHRVEQHG
jgi:glycosyltransferase involved in cell wall biosynthesis